MGLAIIQIRIMPGSPDTDLEEIEKQAKKIIEKEKGSNLRMEKQPIAFGLNAIILTFTREENSSTEELEQKLRKIKEVNSAEIIDFRRAIG